MTTPHRGPDAPEPVDTKDARKRVRLVIGGVILALLVVAALATWLVLSYR